MIQCPTVEMSRWRFVLRYTILFCTVKRLVDAQHWVSGNSADMFQVFLLIVRSASKFFPLPGNSRFVLQFWTVAKPIKFCSSGKVQNGTVVCDFEWQMSSRMGTD